MPMTDLSAFLGWLISLPASTMTMPADAWLVKSLFGYAVWHYDDVTSVLRDKRWHSAAGRIPEIMGITDERFLQRQGVSILSAEGDTHLRLRRLVAPAFSPRQADRLRPCYGCHGGCGDWRRRHRRHGPDPGSGDERHCRDDRDERTCGPHQLLAGCVRARSST